MRAKNSIGYVEYAYAKQNNMAYTQLKNAANAAFNHQLKLLQLRVTLIGKTPPGFNIVLTNQQDPQAWPISAATYILVHKNPTNLENVKNVLKIL